MLFTDGGEERAQAILEKYNADKKACRCHTHTHTVHTLGHTILLFELLAFIYVDVLKL